jgi:hypothetical protein
VLQRDSEKTAKCQLQPSFPSFPVTSFHLKYYYLFVLVFRSGGISGSFLLLPGAFSGGLLADPLISLVEVEVGVDILM